MLGKPICGRVEYAELAALGRQEIPVVMLNEERQRREDKDLPFDDELATAAQAAAARAVLAVMPAFDDIAKQAGLDGDGD